MKIGIFERYSTGIKLLISFAVILIGFCLTSFLYAVIAFAGNPESFFSGEMLMDVYMMRLLQILQSFFVFILPTLLLACLFDSEPKTFLNFGQKNTAPIYILVVLASIAVIPFINWLAYWNEQIHLPEAFSSIEAWMLKTEEAAAKTMEQMLQMDSFGMFLFNLFLIAVLAAVSEELLFRSLLQRLFMDLTKNIHAAIWISAFIFSAIHLQFYGFFPRLLLGAYFGYLLWHTKSIRIPILAHFINNALAVVLSYLEQLQLIDKQWEDFGMNNNIAAGISLLLFTVCTRIIYSKKIELKE